MGGLLVRLSYRSFKKNKRSEKNQENQKKSLTRSNISDKIFNLCCPKYQFGLKQLETDCFDFYNLLKF